MSQSSNGPTGGMPSHDSQKNLVRIPSSNLDGRHVQAKPGPRTKLQQAITLRFVLLAVRQWWKVATPVGLLLAAGAAALVYGFYKPQYEASAWIRIAEKPYIAFKLEEDQRRFVETQIQLIQSPLVLGPVVSQPEIARVPELQKRGDPIDLLMGGINVGRKRDSELLQVSFRSVDEEASARVCNAVVTAYLALQDKEKRTRSERVIQLLDEEKSRRAPEVGRLRENVRELTRQATGKDPFGASPTGEGSVASAMNHPLASLKNELTTAEVNREIAEAEIEAFEELMLGLGSKGTASSGEWRTIAFSGEKNDLEVKVAKPEKTSQDITIKFVADRARGDLAIASFDEETDTLTADVDPTATTANAVIGAINSEGTCEARLNANSDGTGLICRVEVPAAVVEAAVDENAEIQKLRAELSAKQSRLAELEGKCPTSIEHAADGIQRLHLQLTEQISQDRKTLEKFRADRRREVAKEQEKSFLAARVGQAAAKQLELEKLRTREVSLRGRYESQLKNVKEYSGETLDLVFAKDKLKRAVDVLDRIEDRIVQLRTEQPAPSSVTSVQSAKVPSFPVGDPWSKLVLACLAALCVPFGLAVAWERVVRRVTDVDQLEEHSHLGVVGEVARLPVRAKILSEASSRRMGRDLDVFEESIDTLRTCLILSEAMHDMKVLAITSGTKREGKTSVAVQLAVSIARASGQPTLLIDGDMRSPDVHNLLESPLGPGLGDVLAHTCALQEAIVGNGSEDLHILPAGEAHVSPHKLLGNGEWAALLEEARASYRYVIVDTPPVLAAGEALVLASAADASLICAMRDVSRIEQIRRTQQRLVAAGARPIGVVLSGIPTKRYAYRYGAYAYAGD